MNFSKKKRFIYNEKSLKYEEEPISWIKMISGIGLFLGLVIICGFGFNRVLNHFFPNIQYKQLEMELSEMKLKYDHINAQMNLMSSVVENLKERDQGVYRMIFGINPMDNNIWEGGIGGNDPYEKYENFNHKKVLINTLEKTDKLSRKLTLLSKSLDEIEKLADRKEEFLNALPSIKPVREDKLKRKIKYLSGFGMRIHPIHKIPKFHQGLDFSAPMGTEIQATGNGKVVNIENKKFGYGLNITIDHGFGYKTFYAHLSKVHVKLNQKISKGELIGEIGNTGTSTAPHLHYEVHYKGKPVDPINFVLDGLSPEEYDELVKNAAESKKSFD